MNNINLKRMFMWCKEAKILTKRQWMKCRKILKENIINFSQLVEYRTYHCQYGE